MQKIYIIMLTLGVLSAAVLVSDYLKRNGAKIAESATMMIFLASATKKKIKGGSRNRRIYPAFYYQAGNQGSIIYASNPCKKFRAGLVCARADTQNADFTFRCCAVLKFSSLRGPARNTSKCRKLRRIFNRMHPQGHSAIIGPVRFICLFFEGALGTDTPRS